jgi:hypothetical protein|tara:strand:+ start:80 stop:532 length:453 start_codon:yes stop_codon:yes gene_type:complete
MTKSIKIVLLFIFIFGIIYINAISKNMFKESMSNQLLHSGPNTIPSENYNIIDSLTKVKYKQRKSITGKFEEYGPEHTKENYKFNIKSCHCPPFKGPLKNNIKSKPNFEQVYPTRLSTTAMFYDNGPLPNNEYNYDSFINGCDCPKCGAS